MDRSDRKCILCLKKSNNEFNILENIFTSSDKFVIENALNDIFGLKVRHLFDLTIVINIPIYPYL